MSGRSSGRSRDAPRAPPRRPVPPLCTAALTGRLRCVPRCGPVASVVYRGVASSGTVSVRRTVRPTPRYWGDPAIDRFVDDPGRGDPMTHGFWTRRYRGVGRSPPRFTAPPWPLTRPRYTNPGGSSVEKCSPDRGTQTRGDSIENTDPAGVRKPGGGSVANAHQAAARRRGSVWSSAWGWRGGDNPCVPRCGEFGDGEFERRTVRPTPRYRRESTSFRFVDDPGRGDPITRAFWAHQYRGVGRSLRALLHYRGRLPDRGT